MSDFKSKQQELDEFWDIQSLVPKRATVRPTSKSTAAVPINYGEDDTVNSQNKLSEDTLIKRFIPPYDAKPAEPPRYVILTYVPESSLLHKVTVYKEKSNYTFYADFVSRAKSMWDVRGVRCEYAEFFSYSPQYNQLNKPQLSYYLWWRECLRAGEYIKTNSSYVDLYTFELINCADKENAEHCRDMMVNILFNYSPLLGGTKARYIRRIIDFSLVHRLPPPRCAPKILALCTGALKEYFVRIPGNTPEGWARTLLEYCCSYDYKTSKFATAENIGLFDTHVAGAIAEVVKKLSEDGKILSRLPFGDCKICAPAFEGAVCASENRYTLEVEYCSFSRSHELRFLIGDAVKYAENKIRAHISVKSRLTVYSLSNELCEVIDAYFARALPVVRRTAQKPEKREAYDVLYDLPQNKLSLTNADKIERESWSVTRELVEDFDTSELTPEPVAVVPVKAEGTLCGALGEYADAVIALKNANALPLYELAKDKSKALEAICDEVNEIAVNIIGDIIIEENDGVYSFVEDYADALED